MINGKYFLLKQSLIKPLSMVAVSIILGCLIVCGGGQADFGKPAFIQARPSVDEYIHSDLLRGYDIEIRGANQNRPQTEIHLSQGANSCGFTIELPQQSARTALNSIDNGKTIELNSGPQNNRFYMFSVENFEWEIILNERPASNTLQYRFSCDNLVFYYQDPNVFKAHEDDYDFADNVPGSYAVYYKQTPGKNHQTGKAFHIYRPYAADEAGRYCWCDLAVDTLRNIMSIAIPAEFLDEADYPVTVDPTFGCTTKGATGLHLDTDNFRHQVNYGGHEDADGYMQTAYICGYRTSSGAACTLTVAVYSYSASPDSCRKISVTDKIPVTRVAINPDSAEWFSASITGSLIDDEEYIVSWQGWESCDYCLRVCGDYTGQWGYERRSSYAGWGTNNDLTGYQSNGYRYSVYVEYQDSVGQDDSHIRTRKIKRSY